MSTDLFGNDNSPVLVPVFEALKDVLPRVSADTVRAIAEEVPEYRALQGNAQLRLTTMVHEALEVFFTLTSSSTEPAVPLGSIRAMAFELGRIEAQQGRSLDALLAAYRLGARIAWRTLARVAVDAGLPSDGLVTYADQVFAYIEELSGASVAGYARELASQDRTRARNLENLAHGLVTGAPAAVLEQSAVQAAWNPPEQLRAVVLAADLVDLVSARIDARCLRAVEEVPDLPPGAAVLLVPYPEPRLARALAVLPADRVAVIGPVRPWQDVGSSYRRALRASQLRHQPGRVVDADDLLAELVLTADRAALSEVRDRALQPLASLPGPMAERLSETLRAWLLHLGNRQAVAAELHVHPQTVRYRMGQVRELFGARLDDPRQILELVLALGIEDGFNQQPTP